MILVMNGISILNSLEKQRENAFRTETFVDLRFSNMPASHNSRCSPRQNAIEHVSATKVDLTVPLFTEGKRNPSMVRTVLLLQMVVYSRLYSIFGNFHAL